MQSFFYLVGIQKLHPVYFSFSLLEFYFALVYVNQIGSINGIGNQSCPYPNINTAIGQNQDKFFELTLILVASSTPYNFSQSDLWPNLNLTLMYFPNLLILLIYVFRKILFFFIQDSKLIYATNCPFPK